MLPIWNTLVSALVGVILGGAVTSFGFWLPLRERVGRMERKFDVMSSQLIDIATWQNDMDRRAMDRLADFERRQGRRTPP